METFINEVDIQFPYPPYQLQIDYMNKVIESCDTGKYAILESPTGTGKTLSLLCAVFSWKRSRNINKQIIYSSRTHSQLSNVIKELKKTIFRPTISQIASRSHLCLNENIKKLNSGTQSRACIELQKRKQCIYSDDEKIFRTSQTLLHTICTLDEFKEFCKESGACPYFCAQKNIEKSELILTPYSYIADPNIRINLPSSMFNDSIIIIDEAHNFPEQCCEYLSINFPISFFSDASSTLLQYGLSDYIGTARTGGYDISTLNLASKSLKEIYDNLMKYSNNYKIISSSEMYKIFNKSNINESNIRQFNSLMMAITDLPFYSETTFYTFENVSQFIRQMFPCEKQSIQEIDKYYEICVNDNMLNLFCFSPALPFQQLILYHPHTVIMTSGTISPFQSFIENFDYNFPILLENPHIADSSQIYIAISSKPQKI